ncbi:NAD(P)/FAD-dependent oxidoreductase [Variovorax ginsengisoli]|uniref:D-amino-acid dehydrogenase n=1 Tax=Variovorax ginsengisoli TaxID=363844 RepID=A0ABT9S3V0_9BURK|nr:FAD-binding oxidoreductase [Variovorax ginsengisoli]MDP9899018.1 D-amino-acid dehydrogenase [Variovorax ginsengisoli]
MTPNRHEVIVLGAGMVGVSTALALQERGHAVTLIDRKMPGRETSYGNAGIIQREAVEPYAFPRDLGVLFRVATGLSNDARYHLGAMAALAPRLLRYWHASAPARYQPIAQAYATLIRHSIDAHAHWIDQADAGHLVHRDGWRQAYRSAQAFDTAAAHARAVASTHELGCVVQGPLALAAAEPGLKLPMAGAIHWTDPWTVRDPGDLVASYAKLFVLRGGQFAHGDALSLRPQGAGWSVDAAEGPVQAADVVVALGPWADTLTRQLGYRLPLFVKRGYHRHYEGGTRLAVPMLDTERGVMLAPMSRGLRLTTGAEFARHDATPTPVQLQRAERSTAQLLVALGTPVEAEPWLGARPCTVDMKPVLGPAPRHRGLWFNFGHAHQGFTLGPVTGRLVAELVGGDKPFVDPSPFLASRFD